jgi:adenylate cyclase
LLPGKIDPYNVQAMNLRFGEYLLLRQERQLQGPEGTVELGDRTCDVLVTLLAGSGQIVTKQDLMDAVWPGVAVEENTLQVHVSSLRKALGPSHIQTVHGRGYKYVGPKPRPESTGADQIRAAWGEQSSSSVAGPNQDRKTTSLAVLPFSASADDRDQQLLAEGLVEDLITELARYRHLTVIGNGLSSHYRESGTARTEISKELGVDFVICGSVRTAAKAFRVVVQLIDIDTGAVAWGDRFDREIGGLFAMQDEIVAAVVARLSYNLDAAAEKQRRRDPTSSGSAYVQFLQARSHWRNAAPRRALACALKAIEMDPDYGRAHAYAGYFYAYGRFGQWFDLTIAELDANANCRIERALAADPTDPFILQRAAMTYLMWGDSEAALRFAQAAALESALDSDILVVRGLVLAFAGRKDEGAELLERAIALEPRLAPGCYSALAEVRHMQRDYRGSQAVLDMIPKPPFYVRLLKAANLSRMGEIRAAQSLVEAIPADFDCALCARSEAKMCAQNEDTEHWLESFRKAGICV